MPCQAICLRSPRFKIMPDAPPLCKYPRTPHLEGSRLQPGDEDLASIPFQDLAGRFLVVEEKVDGANAALSFSSTGKLLLQSRGHYLTGGPRERQFTLFKRWAHHHAAAFHKVLEERYVLYGEWLYARHTIFYDRLPHYFLEFDVLDRSSGEFLSTSRRRALLRGLPLVPVPVLAEGRQDRPESIVELIGLSRFIGPDHLVALRESCVQLGLDPEGALAETDRSGRMEGLYVKVEEAGVVQERYKFVRPSFFTAVLESGSHWLERPLVPNQLASGVLLW